MFSVSQRNVLSTTFLLVACSVALLLTVVEHTVAHAMTLVPLSGQNLQPIDSTGGQTTRVVVESNYAYIIVGYRLLVLDVTNPAAPVEVGHLVLDYEITEIAQANGFLYLAGESGLHIISISDPLFPVEVGYFRNIFPGSTHVALQGNYAYLTTVPGFKTQELHIVDISKPASPTKVGNYIFTGESNLPAFVAVHGNYVYLLSPWSVDLLIVDVSDPHAARLASRIAIPTPLTTYKWRTNLVVSDDTAYISYLENSSVQPSSGLVIVDVSNPLEPTYKSELTSPFDDASLNKMVVVGDYLYWGGNNRIEIVNVADHKLPFVEKSFDATSSSFVVSDNRLYNAALDKGLQIFDLSIPITPTLLATYNDDVRYGSFGVVTIKGNYLYAYGGGGLQILDLSAPTMKAISGLDITGKSLTIDQNTAYLPWENDGVETNDCYGLHSIDITNPFSLTLTRTIQWGCTNIETPFDPIVIYAIENQRLYTRNEEGKLQVVDLMPAIPTLLGTYEPIGYSIVVKGNYAYVANVPTGITVLDVSRATTPTVVSNYSEIGNVYPLTIADSYLIANDERGLHILDVSDSTNLVELGSLTLHLRNPPQIIVGNGEYLYYLTNITAPPGVTVTEKQELHILDISNPSLPIEIAVYPIHPVNYGSIAIQNHKVYVAAGTNGLLTLQMSGAISGKVVDSFGKPHAGVKVTLSDGQSSQTNAQGDYSFASLTPGSYTVKVESSTYDFQPSEQTLRVPSYSHTATRFTLMPKPLSAAVTPASPVHLSYTDLQGNSIDFDVPAGAVTQPTDFNVLPQASAAAPGQYFTGVRFDLQTGEVNGAGTPFTFTAPLTITLHYTASAVAPVTDRKQLLLRWWNGSVWVDATTTCASATPALHDLVSRALTTTVCQSGQFALFGPTVQHFLPLVSRSQVATSELRGHFVAQHSGKCLNVLAESQQNGANIIQWPCVDGDNEIWTVRSQGEYVQLAAKHSQKCLNVSNASQTEGAQVIQYSCSGGDNELWRLLPVGDNLYQIVAKHSGLCLTVQDASQEDKAQVVQRSCNESQNQSWRFETIK